MHDLRKTAERIEAIGSPKVVVRSCDTTCESAVKALYADIYKCVDKVHVLINSAGALHLGLIGAIEPSLWWNNLVSVPNFIASSSCLLTDLKETNFKGPFLMVHYLIKTFGDTATIITLSSIASKAVHPGMSSYAATKLAINRVEECLQVGKERLPRCRPRDSN